MPLQAGLSDRRILATAKEANLQAALAAAETAGKVATADRNLVVALDTLSVYVVGTKVNGEWLLIPAAAKHVTTPEAWGAKGLFDPVYAGSVFGTADYDAYLTAQNDSLAWAKMLQFAQQNPGTKIEARGSYYFGPLSGDVQRQYGRSIYGSNANLYATDRAAQYEGMPVAGERIKDLVVDGQNCVFYQGKGLTTLLMFAQCDGIHFTGRGKMLGYCENTLTTDTENYALVRMLIGTRNWSFSKGWHLGAFLGDGFNIGGTNADGAGTDPAFAAYNGVISASMQERVGNNRRPWYHATAVQGKYNLPKYANDGEPHGSMSRLCVSVIHAKGILIDSQDIRGGVDNEPNVDGQLLEVFVQNARFPKTYVIPITEIGGAGKAHPWQEEQIVDAATAGAKEVQCHIDYTSRSDNLGYVGGGIFNVDMEYGYVKMHNQKVVPVDNLRFGAGQLIFGQYDAPDNGHTSSGGLIRNVTGKTVYVQDLYLIGVEAYFTKSLVVLAGNVRNSAFENITVADARYTAVAPLPFDDYNNGNSEQGNSFIDCRNVGTGDGSGAVFGFTPDASSRAFNAFSAKQGAVTVPSIRQVTLNGETPIDYTAMPAAEYVINNLTAAGATPPVFGGVTNMGTLPVGSRIRIRVGVQPIDFNTGEYDYSNGSPGLVVSIGRAAYVTRGGWGGRPLVLGPGDWLEFLVDRANHLVELERHIVATQINEIPINSYITAQGGAIKYNELLHALMYQGLIAPATTIAADDPVYDTDDAPIWTPAENFGDYDINPAPAQNAWSVLTSGSTRAPRLVVPALPTAKYGYYWVALVRGKLSMTNGKAGQAFIGLSKNGAAPYPIGQRYFSVAGESAMLPIDEIIGPIASGDVVSFAFKSGVAGQTITVNNSPAPYLILMQMKV